MEWNILIGTFLGLGAFSLLIGSYLKNNNVTYVSLVLSLVMSIILAV